MTYDSRRNNLNVYGFNWRAYNGVAIEVSMELYSENESYKLYHGNMLDMLEVIQPESIDAIITDPPYGLTSITQRFGKEGSAPAQFGTDGAFSRLSKGFMGKEWDGSGIEYNVDAWRKCFTVLKDGGYLLAFGGTRTFHRIACAIEDAGFEIRDTIMWLYGSGFPKSLNLGLAIDKKNGVDNRTGKMLKGGNMLGIMNDDSWQPKEFIEERKAQNEWAGWGTCLKPAYEPIIVARKPFKGSLVDNVLENGVGGLNIDECRVGDELIKGGTMPQMGNGELGVCNYQTVGAPRMQREDSIGRFPANVILTYDETDKDEVCGGMPNTKGNNPNELGDYGFWFDDEKRSDKQISRGYDDEGSAARYFYCAKASKRDRDAGLEAFEEIEGIRTNAPRNSEEEKTKPRKNIHPTVKPVELMQYLIRLVAPKGSTILDPFNGSGSTGKAVMYENNDHNKEYKYIGIELTDEYLPISKARIEHAQTDKERLGNVYVDKINNIVYENASLFDILEEE